MTQQHNFRRGDRVRLKNGTKEILVTNVFGHCPVHLSGVYVESGTPFSGRIASSYVPWDGASRSSADRSIIAVGDVVTHPALRHPVKITEIYTTYYGAIPKKCVKGVCTVTGGNKSNLYFSRCTRVKLTPPASPWLTFEEMKEGVKYICWDIKREMLPSSCIGGKYSRKGTHLLSGTSRVSHANIGNRLFCPVPEVKTYSFTPYLLSDGSFDMSEPFTQEKARALTEWGWMKAGGKVTPTNS